MRAGSTRLGILFGERARQARLDCGMQMREASNKLGYSTHSSLYYVEHGVGKMPIALVYAMAVLYGKPLSYFLPTLAEVAGDGGYEAILKVGWKSRESA